MWELLCRLSREIKQGLYFLSLRKNLLIFLKIGKLIKLVASKSELICQEILCLTLRNSISTIKVFLDALSNKIGSKIAIAGTSVVLLSMPEALKLRST